MSPVVMSFGRCGNFPNDNHVHQRLQMKYRHIMIRLRIMYGIHHTFQLRLAAWEGKFIRSIVVRFFLLLFELLFMPSSTHQDKFKALKIIKEMKSIFSCFLLRRKMKTLSTALNNLLYNQDSG